MKIYDENAKSSSKTLFDIALFLTLVFTALRACNVVKWGWVIVLSPIIIYAFVGAIVVLSAVLAGITLWLYNWGKKKG